MAKFRYQIWYKNLLRSPLILIIYEQVQNWNVIVPILASKFKPISQSQFLRIFTIPIYNGSYESSRSLIFRSNLWPYQAPKLYKYKKTTNSSGHKDHPKRRIFGREHLFKALKSLKLIAKIFLFCSMDFDQLSANQRRL